jgi:hypothetical protein
MPEKYHHIQVTILAASIIPVETLADTGIIPTIIVQRIRRHHRSHYAAAHDLTGALPTCA